MRFTTCRFSQNFRSVIYSLVSIYLLTIPLLGSAATGDLPGYNIDKSQTSVSGLSAGGYMAVQVHIAYSSLMKGAGIFAGGPYQCAEGNLNTALSRCMSPNLVNPAPTSADIARFIQKINSRASNNLVDDPTKLAEQKVWIFSGTQDDVVRPAVVNTLPTFYSNFMPASNIVYKNDINTFHNIVTVDWGKVCNYKNNGFKNDPYINDCDYDAAGALLQHIYGPLNPRNGGTLSGQFIEFNQSQFINAPRSKSLDDTGWAYVPASCGSGTQCKLHVSFHGCEQYYEKIGDKYVKNSGFNQWADMNNMIILYPQAIKMDNGNPKGCFDWWGYTESGAPNSKLYDTKKGAQMAAIKGMIDQISSGFCPSGTCP